MKTTVCGREIEYGLSDKGIFEARYNGEAYKHATLAGLKSALERQIKKKALDISVIKVEDNRFADTIEVERGTVVSVHSGNGNLMVRFGDEPAEQFHSYRNKLLKGETNVKTIKALHKKMKEAEAAYNEFLHDNRFDRAMIPSEEQED